MKKENKEEFVKVCPNCGSTNVRPDLSKDMLAWGGSTRMECRNCGYSSIVFPEIIKSKLEEFRSRIKDRTQEENEQIKKMSKTKGFTSEKISLVFLIAEVTGILSSVILIIVSAFAEENNGLILASGTFLLLLALFALISRRIDKK